MPTTPGMPAVAREHEAGVALGIAGLLDLRQRLVEDPLVERLPLDVEPLEPAGQRRAPRPGRRSAAGGGRRPRRRSGRPR